MGSGEFGDMESRETVFLTALHIRKVRHLTDITIPLSKDRRKNLILTGKNGSGKTSVLESLREHLRYIVSDRFADEETCRSALDGSLTKGERRYWEENLSHWTEAVPAYNVSREALVKKYAAGEFILAYHGDRRTVADVVIPHNIEKVDLQPVYAITDSPSRETVRYMVNLKAKKSFARDEGQMDRVDEIENWFQRFEQILRVIYDDDSLRLSFDIENFQFQILQKGREPFDFATMSMGYAAVFEIICDLMMRMESQHRYDLEGIVLIDEIETHLHVDLQKKIVPVLTELFPNIQFIMTAHSPFILNSAPNSVVYDLERRQTVENGLINLPYEGVVEGWFGADCLSQELRQKFDRYCLLAKQQDLSDADYAEIAGLEQYLDKIPDWLALDISEEYNRLKLELENRA